MLDASKKTGYNIYVMKQRIAAFSKEASKLKRRHSLVNLIGLLLLVISGLLVALMFYINSPQLQDVYRIYLDRLHDVEGFVLDLRDVRMIILVVFLLYIVKSVLSFIPLWLMILISGAVLPMHISFAVNIAGMVVLVSIRYWWGRRLGGGQLERLLGLNRDIRSFLEGDSKGKPWLLFLFRVVPSFPLNPVSQIYGVMGFDFLDYILISLLGFLPSLIMYTIVGTNAYRPLSIPFLIPLIIIFTLSGISVIGINLVLQKRMKSDSNKKNGEEHHAS